MAKRTLLLLRHAKSDWKSGASGDHDRQLNHRGERAAVLMGAYLAQRASVPDLIVCSSAVRAQQTTERLLAGLGKPDGAIPVAVEPKLYMAAPKPCLSIVRSQDDAVESLMIVGHNPGLQELAVMLAANGDPAAGSAIKEAFPTAGLAIYRHTGGWAKIAAQTCELLEYTFPKALV